MFERTTIVAGLCLCLAGCSPEETKYPQWAVDQVMRQGLFKECLRLLPAGPQATKYNDWDEVVGACNDASRQQSMYCYANCPPSRSAAVTSKDEAAR